MKLIITLIFLGHFALSLGQTKNEKPKYLNEKDALIFIGLMSIANKNFDKQVKINKPNGRKASITHVYGLNIFALIVDNTDGQIIGQKQNAIHSNCNPMMHAEQLTLKEAIDSKKIKRPRQSDSSVEEYYRTQLFNSPNTVGELDSGCTIYTTLEPCPFCTSALLVSRMKRIVYIIPDEKYGGSFNTLKDRYYKRDDVTYECLQVDKSTNSRLISFANQKQQELKNAIDCKIRSN